MEKKGRILGKTAIIRYQWRKIRELEACLEHAQDTIESLLDDRDIAEARIQEANIRLLEVGQSEV